MLKNNLLATLPMLAVMVVIFVFSQRAGDVSSEQSNAVGEWVLGILGIEIPPGQSASDVDIIWGFTIRKCAHIFFVSAPRGKRIFVCLTFAVSYGTGVAARYLRGRRGGNILSLCLFG